MAINPDKADKPMHPRESRREGCAALHPGQECWEGCADSVTCKVGRWPAECYRCVTDERNLLRWALTEIANRPTVERNPACRHPWGSNVDE